MIDTVYIAASALDFRFTRTCVASVRYFYPTIPVRILAGGPLQRGLAEELRRYWDVELADFPGGDYGWGFVKLEPLFRAPGERFLVLDSDTVLTGPVLDELAQRDEDLIVDREDQSPERAREIYFDAEKAAQGGLPLAGPAFLFNTGQWIARSGVLKREDFSGLVAWGLPPKLTHPEIFKNGEQGIFNFVVNRRCQDGTLRVARVPLMRWPGHGMQGLDADAVSSGTCPSRVVHWAGMKRLRQRDMVGAGLLRLFENYYYERLPAGRFRRVARGLAHALSVALHEVRSRIRLGVARLRPSAARSWKSR